MRLFKTLVLLLYLFPSSFCYASGSQFIGSILTGVAVTPHSSTTTLYEDYKPIVEEPDESTAKTLTLYSIKETESYALQREEESSKPVIEILDDYDGIRSETCLSDDSNTPIKIVERVEDETIGSLQLQTVIHHETKNGEEPKKPGILRRAGWYVGYSIFQAGRYTVKVTTGTISAYFLSASANQVIATATYNIVLYATANPLIGKLSYTFVRATPALTTVLVWKAGYEAPDILYYTSKGVWKVVNLTSRGIKYTVNKVKSLMSTPKERNELIEMVNLQIAKTEEIKSIEDK